MAHSLNNAEAQNFMERVASHSTKGSRRGFVDIPVEMPDDQLNPHSERLRILQERNTAALHRQSQARKYGDFGKNARGRNILANAYNGRLGKRKLKAALQYEAATKEINEIRPLLAEARQAVKEWNFAQSRSGAEKFKRAAKRQLSKEQYKAILDEANSNG